MRLEWAKTVGAFLFLCLVAVLFWRVAIYAAIGCVIAAGALWLWERSRRHGRQP